MRNKVCCFPFNRTMLELKWVLYSFFMLLPASFNRTMLELKCGYSLFLLL